MIKIFCVSVKEESQEFVETILLEVDQKDLILYNDDHNTFEHVISCLQNYCDHSSIQAEQCAWIVHNNGKCNVKRAPLDKLKPICEALLDAGLSAVIE